MEHLLSTGSALGSAQVNLRGPRGGVQMLWRFEAGVEFILVEQKERFLAKVDMGTGLEKRVEFL